MDLETYKKTYSGDDEAAPGWDAIDARLATIYGDREPDSHFGTVIKFMLGGPDPIDGVSIYKRDTPAPHLHYVSYGMSSLYYDEDSVGGEFSKWGFEFSFRLAVEQDAMPKNDDEMPVWPINLMQNLARYVYQNEKWFEDGHFLKTNGPIEANGETAMRGLLFSLDPELGSANTPHGKVDFLQLVGITEAEALHLYDTPDRVATLVEALKAASPLMVTDMAREKELL